MTARLIASVTNDWDAFDGWVTSIGMDYVSLEPDRAASLAYWWLTRSARENVMDTDKAQAELKKFDGRLWQPPRGQQPAEGSPWDPAEENKALGALMKSLGIQEQGGAVTQ